MEADYKDDNTWLMLGDCLERMKEIPDGSVDCVISDIPYGIDFATWDVTHNNTNSALLGSSPAQDGVAIFKRRGKPLNGWSEDDKKRGAEFQDWCGVWLVECLRVLKDSSPLLLMTGRQLQHRLTVSAEDVGFTYKDYLVWNKGKAPFRAQRVSKVLAGRGIQEDSNFRLGNLAPMHEPIVWLSKPYKVGGTITDQYLSNGLGCFNADVLTSNIINVSSHINDRIHETQKPTNLIEILVNLVTKEGHVVLDMFSGSGTTGVACKNLNRKFIGVEMDENYFEISKNRILET